MPDGKSLLAQSDESGELEFWRLPANGVGRRDAAHHQRHVFRFAGVPSPDGKWLAWADKDQKFWIHDIETQHDDAGRWTPPARCRSDDFAWSPDSQWLAYVRPGANTVAQIHALQRHRPARAPP